MLKHLFWPETIFARLNTAGQQLDHILSEADEITELGPELESVLDDSAAADRVRMMIDLEMFDLHHAIETRIRILAREKGVAYVAMLVEEVRKKNRARGYYVDGINGVVGNSKSKLFNIRILPKMPDQFKSSWWMYHRLANSARLAIRRVEVLWRMPSVKNKAQNQ